MVWVAVISSNQRLKQVQCKFVLWKPDSWFLKISLVAWVIYVAIETKLNERIAPWPHGTFCHFQSDFSRCMDHFHAGLTNPFYQSSSYFYLFHVPSSYFLHLNRLWYQFTDFLHWLSRIYASNLCEGSFTKSVQESYWFDFPIFWSHSVEADCYYSSKL